MEDGFKFLFTLEGLMKLLSVAFSCVTFALLAASKTFFGSSALKWVLAAYIISFSISFLFLLFRITRLSTRMSCGSRWTYDGFDFLWAWFCVSWCFAGAITFAVHYPTVSSAETVVSIIFAFCTFVVYAIEAFLLRQCAPSNIGYVATAHGWAKTAIVVFGCSTFGLMVDSGYPDSCDNEPGGTSGCVAGLTYALVVFTVAWSISTIMWLAHLFGPSGSVDGNENFKKAEIVWAVIGVLFFWSGASVFAVYMSKNCKDNDYQLYERCQKRASGVTAGFLTGALYLAEIFVLR